MNSIDKYVFSAFSSESLKNLAIKALASSPLFLKKMVVNRYTATQRKAQERSNGPSSMFFFVTNRCNLRCSHCFFASELSKSYDELSVEEIRKVADSLEGTSPSIIICGGEPFLRDDIDDILLAFAQRAGSTELTVTTNGFFLDRMMQSIEAITGNTECRLRMVVSLDGMRDVHNRIRGNDQAFDKAELAIKTLEKYSGSNNQVKPIINSVISTANIDSYTEFYKYVRDNYGCDHTFTFLRQDAYDVFQLDRSLLWDSEAKPDLLPSLDRCRSLIHDIRGIERYSYLMDWRLKVREYHLNIVENKKPMVECIAPRQYSTLYPDGGVSICEVVQPFANVRDFGHDFIRCWNSDSAERQRKQLSSCYCTYPCALTETMFQDPKPIMEVLNDKH